MNCFTGIERQMTEQRHADGRAVGEEGERVAVGGALQHGMRRGDAAGSRHILDDEILAQFLTELLGDQTRRDVGNAAGPEWHKDADRMVGIGRLRRRDGGQAG